MVNEKRVAQIVQHRFKTLDDAQRDIFDDVETYHQMYRAFLTDDEYYPWDFKLTDPIVFYLLKYIMARLNPEHMTVRLEARNPEWCEKSICIL